MRGTILIVEDENDIRELLSEFLKDAGYNIITAIDGLDGLEKFKLTSYDLIILDVMMPKIDGYVLCEVIRKESNVPIIMLTALDSEEEELKGFNLNIDDYITKPFSIKLLLKRIETIFRRSKNITNINTSTEITYKNIRIDTNALIVFVNDTRVNLTIKEYELLLALIKSNGHVLSREELLTTLWQYDYYGDSRVVDTHIKNLRKKLNVDFIQTVRGVGYIVN